MDLDLLLKTIENAQKPSSFPDNRDIGAFLSNDEAGAALNFRPDFNYIERLNKIEKQCWAEFQVRPTGIFLGIKEIDIDIHYSQIILVEPTVIPEIVNYAKENARKGAAIGAMGGGFMGSIMGAAFGAAIGALTGIGRTKKEVSTHALCIAYWDVDYSTQQYIFLEYKPNEFDPVSTLAFMRKQIKENIF